MIGQVYVQRAIDKMNALFEPFIKYDPNGWGRHVFVGTVVTVILYIFHLVLLAFPVCFTLGYFKERYDKSGTGVYDKMDIFFTALPGFLGLLFYIFFGK